MKNTSTDSGRAVVVIGGGFSGLATAGLLAASGHRVTLLEKQEELGGRAGRLRRAGFSFDTGPSWYLMPEVIEHWFELMGTSTQNELDLVDLPIGYRTWFQSDYTPLDMPSGAGARDAFESLQPGAGDALDNYLEKAAESHDLALEHFLYADLSSAASVLDPRLLPLLPRLAPLLAGSLESFVAKRFSDPRLRQILGYPAVFLGSSPKRTPALYHLMSHLDLTQGVKYPMGGFAQLVDAMAALCKAAGVQIITGAEATGIEVSGTGANARARGVRWIQEGTLRHLEAQTVVGAADLHHLETELLPVEHRSSSAASWKRRDPGPSAVLLCLGISGKLPELSHHNLLFTSDWDDNFGRIHRGEDLAEETSLYVCMPSATDPSVAPADHENLFILVPAPALPAWGTGGPDGTGSHQVENVADAALDQLAAWAGIEDLRERVVVRQSFGPGDFAQNLNAWQGGALGLAHTLGQSAFFRPSNHSSKVSGLHYAGSSVRPGIGIPMCLISAEIIAKKVNGITGKGPIDPGHPAWAAGRTAAAREARP
ncbi:phytoene desaturase family protein [Paeniglutamicibacter psychrophenolicus]|uniref:phytoene desaturase family protein n=1 Tax=Paeniglutamicibacter psychrophenolicus TaxID=257454 RepID=UPI002788B689|nr:phytoene desaturase family protein [Paeniglutamicibacter psychrophenolicus]MDQ0093204.1 phytoene desaturase [Paeniglutamicibacter psychrophenolicus]